MKEEIEVVARYIALEICEATAEQAKRWKWPDDFNGDTIDRARSRAEHVLTALDKHRAEKVRGWDESWPSPAEIQALNTQIPEGAIGFDIAEQKWIMRPSHD